MAKSMHENRRDDKARDGRRPREKAGTANKRTKSARLNDEIGEFVRQNRRFCQTHDGLQGYRSKRKGTVRGALRSQMVHLGDYPAPTVRSEPALLRIAGSTPPVSGTRQIEVVSDGKR